MFGRFASVRKKAASLHYTKMLPYGSKTVCCRYTYSIYFKPQDFSRKADGDVSVSYTHLEGIKETTIKLVKNLMKTMGLTAERALSASGVPEEQWGEYLPQLV